MTWSWGDNPEGIEYYSPPMKLGEKAQGITRNPEGVQYL